MKLFKFIFIFGFILLISGCDSLGNENSSPVVTGVSTLELDLGSEEPNWVQYIEATDEEDGVIRVTSDMVESFVDFDVEGTYEVNYYITDSDDVTIKHTIQVTIIDNRTLHFNLIGDGEIHLDVGSTYNEQGAQCEYDDGTTCTYEISSNLDTNVLGEYTIEYILPTGSDTIERTIYIEDNIAPTFNFEIENAYYAAGSDYEDPLLVIEDNYYEEDFNIIRTGTLDTSTPGIYTLSYVVEDPSENQSVSKDFLVYIFDYSLVEYTNEQSSIVHPNNISFIDSGVELIDEYGQVQTIYSDDTINNSILGTQSLTYEYTDSQGEEYTTTREVEVIQGGPPQVITIMHGAVNEVDPFHESYSGPNQLARQELQEQIEAQFNVIIEYKPYPASAAWGPSRITSIIQSSISGDHLSDIYWISSDWIQQLVEGNALADVSPYMDTIGVNIDDIFLDVGEYQGGIYGFDEGKIAISTGLYYNADLIDSLGVSNPSDLFLDGQWTWSDFETWATLLQMELDTQPDDMYALGGMLSYYAEAMIPLNGGSLIDKTTERVAFNQNPALETYTFLTTLYNKGLFEPSPQYDAGSPDWMSGKVAMHPGSLWFVSASNRWGGLPFELGFVPYPVADDFTGDYVQPVHGVQLMTLASGMTAEKEELVFEVWNALQLWKTEEEHENDFESSLLSQFDDARYVESYLAIYDKVYLDIVNAIGISSYGENGWTSNINGAIQNGTSRTVMDEIAPVYAAALEDYFEE